MAESPTTSGHTRSDTLSTQGFKKPVHVKVIENNIEYISQHLQWVDDVRLQLLRKDIITDEESKHTASYVKEEPDTARLRLCKILSTKRKEDFIGFIEILDNSCQKLLANSIRTEFVAESKKLVQQMHKVRCSTVPRKPWIEDDLISIDKIFINLHLVERQDHRKLDRPLQFRDYTQIFEDEEFKECKLCVITGPPGSGKSTLVSKIAYDWAKEALPSFGVVLVVRLREIEQQGGLLSHVRKLYSESGVLDVLEFLGENVPVLLIWDGLDELNQDLKNTEFQKILDRTEFPNVHLLITTRPHGLTVFRHYQHITLHIGGFSREDFETYIGNYFLGTNPEKTTQVILACVDVNDLWSLVENPLCCLMLCFLYEARYADKPVGHPMPSDITELYREVVEVSEELYKQRGGQGQWGPLVLKMGKLALDMLLARVLIFDDEMLSKYEVNADEVCRAGLMARVESIKGQEDTGSANYSFIHNSVQEFSAALYAHNCSQKECDEFVSQMSGLDEDTFFSLDPFLEFVFGLGSTNWPSGAVQRNNILLKLVYKSVEYLHSETLSMTTKHNIFSTISELCIKHQSNVCKMITSDERMWFLLKSYNFWQAIEKDDTIFIYAKVLAALITPDITATLLENNLHIKMLDLFRCGEIQITVSEMSAVCPFVNEMCLTSQNLEPVETKVFTEFYKLSQICLYQCKFRNTVSLCEFVYFLSEWPNLQVFIIYDPVIVTASDMKPMNEKEIVSKFEGKISLPLKVLDVSGCSCQQVFSCLEKILRFCTNLSDLVFCQNKFNNVQSLAPEIPDSVTVLNFIGCDFMDTDGVTVLSQIQRLYRLEHVCLNGLNMNIVQEGGDFMSQADSSQRSTKRVKLSYGVCSELSVSLCHYQGDPKVILQMLIKLAHAVKLDLSGLDIDSDMYNCLMSLGGYVVGVNMSHCSLNLQVESVKQTWATLTNLKSLDISGIEYFDEQVHQIIAVLPYSVENIECEGTAISPEGLLALQQFIKHEQFQQLTAHGVLVEKVKGMLSVDVRLSQCTDVTSQIFDHCVQGVVIGRLKICGFDADNTLCNQVISTLHHVTFCLEDLQMSRCDMNNESVRSLIVSLHKESLRSLTFSSCSNTTDALKIILDHRSQILKDLKLHKMSLENRETEFMSVLHFLSDSLKVLDLSDCDLDNKCWTAVFSELQRFKDLRELNLTNNPFKEVESEFVSVLPSLNDSLEVLALTRCGLTTDTVNKILKELDRFKQLKELKMAGVSFEHVESEFVSVLLPTSLEVLDLSGCGLSTHCLKMVLNNLYRLKQLRTLNMSGNSFEHVGSEFVSVLLPTSLEELLLSGCDFSTHCMKMVLNILHILKQLRILNMSHNSFENVASQFLSVLLPTSLEVLDLSWCRLSTHCVKMVINKLHRLKQLRILNMSWNSFGNVESEFVSVLLPTSLEVLDLSECDLSTHFAKMLFNNLHRLKQLRTLNISDNSFEHVEFVSVLLPTSIEVLDLTQCALSTHCVKMVLTNVYRLKQLRTLNMSCNSFKHAGSEFVSAIPLLPTSLEVLDLSQCHLSTHCVKMLFDNLYRFKKLRTLNMSRNSLKHVGSEFLSVLLPTSLEELGLSWCKFSTHCVKMVFNNFHILKRLRTLDMSHNSFKHVEFVPDFLPTSLEALNLSWCKLSTHCVKMVFHNLHRLKQLRTLDMSRNSFKHVEREFASVLLLLPTSLEVLGLFDCHLNTNCFMTLMYQLPRLTHLIELDIRHDKLSGRGWEKVLAVVRQLPLCSGKVTVCVTSGRLGEDFERQLWNCRQDINWDFN